MDATSGEVNLGASAGRYTAPAIAFHWLIALGILTNLSVGWFMEDFPGPWRRRVLDMHFSIGLTVLGLVVLRVLWRLFNRPPAHAPMHAWEVGMAKVVHGLLYLFMFLMPLIGWAIISSHPPAGSPGAQVLAAQAQAQAQAAGQPVAPKVAARQQGTTVDRQFWGVLPLPRLAPVENVGAQPSGLALQKQMHDGLAKAHTTGAIVLIALLVLHLSGALKHEFWDRLPSLERMGLPRLHRPKT